MLAHKSKSGGYWQQRPSKSEQLRQISFEAAQVRQEHLAGKLSAEEAAKKLSELKRRYARPMDHFFAP